MQTVHLLKAVIFVLTTLAFAYVSRKSLLAPRSHGFYRFFVWETILALLLLTLESWFQNPFSWNQLISWPLLVASVYLLIHGANLLKHVGIPRPWRNDPTLFWWEETTTLVTVGVYRHIRHPMYSSLLFAAWGLFFRTPSWAAMFLALAATILLIAAARREEEEDLRHFGADYQVYMERTKRFIPFLY
jgi:protein-S-isoprenylcysteine O-methyltransferase Ste14